jgi:hypothetical protein
VTTQPFGDAEAFGCVVHDGSIDRDGYGIMWRGRRPVKAYLVAWERDKGRVPEGRVLDHHCKNRRCIALHHLEPVTQQENLFRRDWSYRARIARCPRGHDMRTNAIVTPWGGRVCRQFNREAR